MPCKQVVENAFPYHDLKQFIAVTNIINYFCHRTYNGIEMACTQALVEYEAYLKELEQTENEIEIELLMAKNKLDNIVISIKKTTKSSKF